MLKMAESVTTVSEDAYLQDPNQRGCEKTSSKQLRLFRCSTARYQTRLDTVFITDLPTTVNKDFLVQ